MVCQLSDGCLDGSLSNKQFLRVGCLLFDANIPVEFIKCMSRSFYMVQDLQAAAILEESCEVATTKYHFNLFQ